MPFKPTLKARAEASFGRLDRLLEEAEAYVNSQDKLTPEVQELKDQVADYEKHSIAEIIEKARSEMREDLVWAVATLKEMLPLLDSVSEMDEDGEYLGDGDEGNSEYHEVFDKIEDLKAKYDIKIS